MAILEDSSATVLLDEINSKTFATANTQLLFKKLKILYAFLHLPVAEWNGNSDYYMLVESLVEKTKRGRPKKIWEETVKDDMRKRNLTIKGVDDRVKWRGCCRQLVDPDDSVWRPGLPLFGRGKRKKNKTCCH